MDVAEVDPAAVADVVAKAQCMTMFSNAQTSVEAG